ncbi:hypothetical protein [Oscillatoria acuminata]|nr:hypothetical protein [Oscillatoria acuminata]
MRKYPFIAVWSKLERSEVYIAAIAGVCSFPEITPSNSTLEWWGLS